MQRKVPSAIANITLNRATFTDVLIDGLTFVNFFYGNNGAGKSSIAHAIAEDDGVVWADGKTVDDFDVLVYNQDFINDNFVNYGDLKGVFIFGEEDIEAKKKIAELTNQKKQKMDARQTALDEYKKKSDGLASALTQFQDTCFSKTASIRRRFEKCMDGKKQKKNFAEAVLGEVKPIDHDLAELERLYDVAFDDSARAYPEFKKAAATTYGSLPGKDLLDRMIVSSSDTPFAKFMKALGDTASDWVRDGHTHYAGAAGGKCPYCQQRLPANFEADIAATFDAQYQQDIRDLGQFQTIYERETREIVRAIQANASDVMPTIDLMAYQEKLALLESNFEINRQRIAEKVKEPSKTISLEDTDTLLLEIGAMIDEINKQIKANNDVVSAKRSSKTKCKTEIMQYLAFKLTRGEFDFIFDLIREENPAAQEASIDAYTKSDFLDEVYMTEKRYENLVAVLRNKKNIILQGAPGVGKTFAAKRLAWSMMGEKDDSRIEFVQFHQNYSYEDFMMGYKPVEDGFELKYGIFYRFCQRAANQPDKEFFFIIDEINRGNMSKIFGELLMLIEKDYRGTKATLAYNGLSFSVPKNLYIIGMMNTADRSLAMIDYALRRRFSFFEVEPGFDSEGFIHYQNGLNNETLNELINKVKDLNREITLDKSLGKGFCIGHSYFCGRDVCTEEWLHSIVDYDILPMLSEYWFDDANKLQRWENILQGVFQ